MQNLTQIIRCTFFSFWTYKHIFDYKWLFPLSLSMNNFFCLSLTCKLKKTYKCNNKYHINNILGVDHVSCIYVFLLQECISGTYGKDCTKKCSKYCLHNRSCNHIDGACTDGCQSGYIGHICNICKTFCKNVFFIIIYTVYFYWYFKLCDRFSLRTRTLRQKLFTYLFLKLQDMQSYWRYMQLSCRLERTQL